LRADLATMLRQFAPTETCRELATAALCLRDVEYELQVDETVVRGVLDMAWQDAAGAWHLLALTLSDRTPTKCWEEQQARMTLAATALHRQMGTWPKTVQLWCASSGEVLRRVGNRLPSRRVLAEVANASGSMNSSARPSNPD
jgi:hypothetical protein